MTAAPAYTVTLGRPIRGHEGESCATGKLLRDGKVVAEFQDDTHGGPMQVWWKDDKAHRVQVSTDWYGRGERTYSVSPEEKTLIEHIKGLPPVECYGKALPQTPELFIGLLAEDAAYVKDMQRAFKAKTVFLGDNGAGATAVFEIKGVDDGARDYLAQKRPGCVILNDLDPEKALVLWKLSAKSRGGMPNEQVAEILGEPPAPAAGPRM
jgi:hypothetical protein